MDKNFCPNCSTENESEYIYCKNCGAQLKPENAAHPQPAPNQNYYQATSAQNTAQGNYYNTYNGFNSISFDGVSVDEMNIYIGETAKAIIPKFNKMELTHSKLSWCWPVAILGFLLGPLGAAIWFFYRKMYKPAMLLTALGTLITFITTIFTPTLSAETLTAMEGALVAYDIEAILELFNSIEPAVIVLTYVMGLIENIANILTCVLCGIYGFHWYKKHCISKIREYKFLQSDPRYYRFGLAAIGGVSGGMVVLGVVIYFVVNTAASVISSILAFLL